MTDITLKQRARQVIADWHREKGCSQQVIEDCLSGNITIPEFYMELLEAALRLSAGAEVDWRAQYRLQTAMRYMDNAPRLTLSEAYKMADHDVRGLELAAAPRHEPGEG